MVLWFTSKVLKDDLLVESFHEIPVVYDAVSDRPLKGMTKRLHVQICRYAEHPWQHGEVT